MKGNIEIKQDVLFVSLAEKAPDYINQRLIELGFVTNNRKRYILTKGITESHLDYLQGIVQVSGLGMPYIPATQKGFILQTVVPDSMGFEMHIAIRRVKEDLGKSLFDYVKEKLGYTDDQLLKSLAAEQVDSVALAIYNIEKKSQGLIIADQTGIGKGRQAAAMIRYGIKQGLKPVFLSEKPNLFSDLYRDLVDIQSGNYVPFIVNAKESKTHIKDKNGNVVYEAAPKPEQDVIFKSKKLPNKYDFICATYSQFNQPTKKPLKPQFLSAVAQDNIVIMDEAHNASGMSQTGLFLQNVLRKTKGVVFLSATFAKRPDNMPIYAQKTAMSEANMSNEHLVDAIKNGGVALQEVISSQLVLEGQLIRRERSFEGVEVNYITLEKKAKEHEETADKITSIIRSIIEFQEIYITPYIEQMDEIASKRGEEITERKGTNKAGVDNTPYFSKIFNVINQMLFSIKAIDVANHAVKMLKKGYKPVIAFSSTMGSFLEEIGEQGKMIDADFSTVLIKGLNSVLTYTEYDTTGKPEKGFIDIKTLGDEEQAAYWRIVSEIEEVSTGISISPIDVITHIIEKASFSVGEVTGRKLSLRFNDKMDTNMALVERRKRENANDLFRKFNDNEIDVLMINQSGSTGASAHAIPTDKVPKNKVKPRVMIILQAELDINTEIQKRGRINRTGQIHKPRYDYINSAIPAEKRLMMMLQKKLKSLDANTTSNQKSSEKQLKTDDFLNKYGDKIVREYLIENKHLAKQLGNPLKFGEDTSSDKGQEGDAHKVSGRVAILSVKEQEKFYNDILERYHDYVDYLIKSDTYDLEVSKLNLEAKTLAKRVTKAGKGGRSAFGQDTFLEKCECNVLRKPLKPEELKKEIELNLNGETAEHHKDRLIEYHNLHVSTLLDKTILALEEKYDKLIEKITKERDYKKLKSEEERRLYVKYRTDELNSAREADIQMKTNSVNNARNYLNSLFSFFTIGRGVLFPSYSFEQETTPAICLGVNIKADRPNPFAPSAIKISFAIADSRRMLSLSLSGETGREIESIFARSQTMEDYASKAILENWQEHIKAYEKSRNIRYIYTGNLLQAVGGKGKLVSYTTITGDTKKGVLMPETWTPIDKEVNSSVNISAKDAIPYIKSLTNDGQIIANSGLGIFRNNAGFKIIIPKGKANAPVYKDKDIINLLNDEFGFTQTSGNFVGIMPVKNIDEFLSILSDRYGVSFNVSRAIFDEIIEPNRAQSTYNEDEYKKAKEEYQKDKENYEKRIQEQEYKEYNDTGITVDNYKDVVKEIDFSKLPDYVREVHNDFDAFADFYDDDEDIRKMLVNHFKIIKKYLKEPKSDDKQKRIRLAKVKATAKLKLLKLLDLDKSKQTKQTAESTVKISTTALIKQMPVQNRVNAFSKEGTLFGLTEKEQKELINTAKNKLKFLNTLK